MKGLRGDIFLHVLMTPVEKTKLRVSAQFISQDKRHTFLDSYVDSREHPCHKKGKRLEIVSLATFEIRSDGILGI